MTEDNYSDDGFADENFSEYESKCECEPLTSKFIRHQSWTITTTKARTTCISKSWDKQSLSLVKRYRCIEQPERQDE